MNMITTLKFVYNEVGLDIKKSPERGHYEIFKNEKLIVITTKPFVWIQGFKFGAGFYED